MPLSFDPEFAVAMASIKSILPDGPKPPAGDVMTRRARFNALAARAGSLFPETAGITRTDHSVPIFNSTTTITLAEFTRSRPTTPSKAIFYIHGGGMILGNLDIYSKTIKSRADEYDIPIFAVGYRLAPEHPHPAPVTDCYTALEWLIAHAEELGVDTTRIVVHGESAGGGLAAGVALMARDRGLEPGIAKLVLNCPMLDDREHTIHADLDEFVTFSRDDNKTGWGALLGEKAGSAERDVVSIYAAPGRAEDLSGLPPTYVDCGQLDLFLDENVAFVTKLVAAKVLVEFHIYPGVPHAFAAYAPFAVVSRMAIENLQRVLVNA